jgi:hypothetical protein
VSGDAQKRKTTAAVKKNGFLLPIQQIRKKVPSMRIFAFQGLKPESF